MKKIILIVCIFQYCMSDFCDELLMGLRHTINGIPLVCEAIPTILTSKPIVALGILATLYLSVKKPQSLPFYRTKKNITEAYYRYRGIKIILNLKDLNRNDCVKMKIKESMSILNKSDEEIEELMKKISTYDLKKIIRTIHSDFHDERGEEHAREVGGMPRVRRYSEINLKELEDIHFIRDLDRCIMKKIFEEVESESKIFTLDNVKAFFKEYIPALVPNIFEIGLFGAIITYLYRLKYT